MSYQTGLSDWATKWVHKVIHWRIPDRKSNPSTLESARPSPKSSLPPIAQPQTRYPWLQPEQFTVLPFGAPEQTAGMPASDRH
ncbi:hypothetical protein [Leptolyngbya ohadii]|uniref:hypothetical protein n=1 Tax=Leptolyngbya ohadii TaxID=1962290 RepID=UPI001179AB19|nr:hypothetical protein [Leptolyngbya ohadii]